MRSMVSTAILAGSVLLSAGCQNMALSPKVADLVLPSGVKFVESLDRKPGDKVVIPYRKFQLDNGLTVILHEDNSDPLVHVDVTYHVGSAREEVGKSGFAHFFEHMMFQGSKHVADEQHMKIVSSSGGTLNGTTNGDRTNYYETVPANQLEKMLWLEADRMGFLLEAVTQEKFEVQRETVKNERGQRVDNRPYGLLSERVGEALYPEGHPYSWMTIGYIEDLDRVNVNDLKAFFLRWYGPNNATLTIGGKFSESEVLTWVNQYFGDIPRGPLVEMPEKPPVKLDADRYISLEDNVALPLLYMAFPTVHLYHKDEAPLDVLMFILGVGETSLLYKNMVKSGLAVQANAGHGCQELSCTFTVVALPNPSSGMTLTDLEKIARDSLVEFESRGVTQADLDRVKMTIVSDMIYGLESVSGKVSRLASYETFTGNPSFAAEDIARYENVTQKDVMRVYRKYILNKPSVVMSVVPKGQGSAVAQPDTWQRFARTLPEYAAVADTDLKVRTVQDRQDTLDRSKVPSSGENPTITVPETWAGELGNGIGVLGALNTETPTTAISLRIPAGQRHEKLEQLGLASLTAAMMNESTVLSTNEELSDQLQQLGSAITFSADNNYASMTIRSLTENLDKTLAIAIEKLSKPGFLKSDYDRVQGQTLQAIEQNKKQAGSTAQLIYQLLLMGEDNTISHQDVGISATVEASTVDDVRSFYQQYYTPASASIVAVSNLGKSDLIKSLSVFNSWAGGGNQPVELQPFPEVDKTRIYLVDKPGAAQSEIRIGRKAMPFDATAEYYRAGLANFVLGGAFNSRLNLNLREDKGYSYGVGSGFRGEEDYGYFSISTSVRTDATAAAIVEIAAELEAYVRDGISADELEFTRNAIGQSDARRFETPMQKLRILSQMQTYELESDYIQQQNQILSRVTKNDLDKIVSTWMNLDDMIMVIVGDRESIYSDLDTLDYEIVELDVEGNRLGSVF